MNDAVELAESLQAYKTQLLAIDEILSGDGGSEEEQNQLRNLQADLVELVEITESQLLNVKKSQLLSEIDSQSAGCSTSQSGEHSRDEPEHDEQDDSETSNLQNCFDQLIGMRCRAPFNQKWGHQLPVSFHNAVILEIVPLETQEMDLAALKVRVLYCNPMYRKMQPCNFFLQSRCKFGVECKFSHGEEVFLSELLEYDEPDFDSMSSDCLCLAKSAAEDLWHLARITEIDKSAQEVAVRFLQSEQEQAVKFEDVLPLAEQTEENATDEIPQTVEEGIEAESCDNTDVRPVSNQALGGWEKHTKGIASKLMAKMGYVVGEGLGKDNTGRVDPVQTRVIPKGKSLDGVLEMSEKLAEKDPVKEAKKLKRQQKMKEKKLQEGFLRNRTEIGIFDFLNRKLKGTAGGTAAEPVNKKQKIDAPFVTEESNANLNVQLFKIDESRKQTIRDVERWKEALKRNEGKDKVMAGQIRKKLTEAEQKLNSYSSQERSIEKEQKKRKDKRKLHIF